MGWFDEQIRDRKQSDAEIFEESFQTLANAVMGKRLSEAVGDDRQMITDAIETILEYYRVKPKDVPEEIRDMNEVLEYLMRPYGIMRRGGRLEKGWYKNAVGAMLGTKKDDGSVVALLPYSFGGYRFYDRKRERYVRVSRRNEDLFEEDAIAFYKPFPLKKMSVRDFMHYLMEQIAPIDLLILVIAMAAASGVGLLMPKLTSALFSDVIKIGSSRLLVGIAIYMVSVSLSALVFSVVQSFATARITTKLDIAVEAASIMRVLSLPATFFKNFNAGELATRIGFLNDLSDKMVNILLSTSLTSLFSLIYISQIFVYAPALVQPSLIITLLTALVSVGRYFIVTGVSKNHMLLTSKENGITHELVGGVQKIRLAGAEQRSFAKWCKLYAESAQFLYNPPMLMRVSGVITQAISLIGTAVMYYLAIKNGVSIAEYYAFTTAYGMIDSAFRALTDVTVSISRIKPTLNMVKPLLETVPEIDGNKTMITSLSGNLELSHVSFRYHPEMPQILNDVSLKIRAGQYVAIVGKTGCGKSTLMRILLGFEKPQKGAVYYDSKDLNKLDPKSLRRQIGSVMQDGKLFMGDIYSNITISAPWLTVDDAWEAAEISGFAEDIRRMPMGMKTVISEGLGSISGGQRQRLMIARAIAPKPKILMFDEATSALDNLTQKRIADALDKMNCTRLVIAHRLSTIRQCDRIIVLDQGKIIEDGSYEQLIKKDGFFAKLVAKQRLDDTEYVAHTTTF